MYVRSCVYARTSAACLHTQRHTLTQTHANSAICRHEPASVNTATVRRKVPKENSRIYKTYMPAEAGVGSQDGFFAHQCCPSVCQDCSVGRQTPKVHHKQFQTDDASRKPRPEPAATQARPQLLIEHFQKRSGSAPLIPAGQERRSCSDKGRHVRQHGQS